MSVFRKNREYRKKRMKSFGFYSVLCLCLLAVGAAAWSATIGVEDGSLLGEDTAGSTGSLFSSQEVDLIVESQPAETSTPSSSSSVRTSSGTSSEVKATAETVSDEPIDTVAHFFVMPITGNIIKKYSDTELQYSETYGDMRLHTGIDIAADLNSVIKSAGNGVVEKVYYDDLYGNTVIIDHGNGVKGYYCGLNNEPSVSEGQVVLSGTQIGSLSTIPCECADAPHFHFAMKKDDVWVSPLAMMNMEE